MLTVYRGEGQQPCKLVNKMITDGLQSWYGEGRWWGWGGNTVPGVGAPPLGQVVREGLSGKGTFDT